MKNNKLSKNKALIIIGIILIVVFLTIGYSSFSMDMTIDNLAAIVRIQKDIRISEIAPVNYTSNAISNWEEHNVNSISSSLELPNADSTITYNIKVTNIGNVESCISEITGLPSNLKYTLNNYNLNDMLCDDNNSSLCKLGSLSTLSITIGYAPNGFNSNNTNYNIELDFTFSYMIDAVAKIGDSYYDTLKDAIKAVPNDNSETTIVLLKNTNESVTIDSTKNINLNLNGKTLGNSGNTNVIVNKGTLKIFGGTVATDASTNGAINNESTGTIIIEGGKIIVTGGRQALYNNNGIATITGNAYLSSSATERATVQNLKDGQMYILEGTIISTGMYAVNNAGALTIGTKDGHNNASSPLLQAVNYGIYSSTNINYYDGIVKSKVDPFNNVSKIADMEVGYGIINSTEIINGEEYKTAHLGDAKEVKFNANGGTVSETIRYVEVGYAVGTLPVPTRSGYSFEGWYTASSSGTQINKNTIINDNVTYYAHWKKNADVAQIDTTIYQTLQDAINAVPSNTVTTITVLKDVAETLNVDENKNIILDLNGKTLANSGTKPIFTNSGTLNITNGALRSSAAESAINNTAGDLTINNCQIISTSTKQAVYITGGTVLITGDSYLSSQTSGKPSGSTMERGTVQVVSGTLIINSGTIVGEKQQAVSNEGTVIIGTKDGNINSTTPTLIGAVHGIKSVGTLKFYDGIIKGKSDSINGSITEQETNSELVQTTEIIDGKTYQISYLDIINNNE